MSESENQEPVVSSDSSSESRVSKLESDGDLTNEAEAKPVSSPSSSSGEQSSSERRSEPDLVSSSKESPGPAVQGQILNNQEMRVRDNVDEEDEDSNDSNDGHVGVGAVGGSNGDRELFNAPICSPYSLHSSSNSKSNPFGSATSQNILRGPILRPSAFKFSSSPAQQPQQQQQSSSSGSSSFVLRPPKLIPNSGSVGCKVQAQATSTTATLQFVPLDDGGKEEEKGEEPGFGISEPTSSSSASGSGGGGFVFGSNLEERAVQGSPPGGKKRKIEGGEDEEEEGGVKKPSVVISGEEASGSDLVREVITGEEEEVNVLQLHCRLFIFDSSNSSWVERGRGLLRLNDSKTPDEKNVVSSRLIIRTKGSLRVMLNTKVWKSMNVEKIGDKNIRLMAVDLEAVEKEEVDGGAAAAVRIFLIMTTSISDAHALVNALESRVRRLN